MGWRESMDPISIKSQSSEWMPDAKRTLVRLYEPLPQVWHDVLPLSFVGATLAVAHVGRCKMGKGEPRPYGLSFVGADPCVCPCGSMQDGRGRASPLRIDTWVDPYADGLSFVGADPRVCPRASMQDRPRQLNG